MDKDEAVRIKLASDYASLMNAYKLYRTQLDGMNRMNAVQIKRDEETQFTAWLNSQPGSIKNQYANLFTDFNSAYQQLRAISKEYYYKIYSVVILPSGNFALELSQIEEMFNMEEGTDADKNEMKNSLRTSAEEMWETMNYDTEVKKVAAYLNMMYEKLPADKPKVLKDIIADTRGNSPQEKFNTWARDAFESSVFTTKEKLEEFLSMSDKKAKKALSKDPLYNYYMEIYSDAQAVAEPVRSASAQIGRLERDYVAAMMQMHPSDAWYPDANFTLRLTYGQIMDYEPRDAVQYNWQTSLSGVIEKMDNNDPEFKVPAKLYDLYQRKDFGRYADQSGEVPVCFLTNNDITGGNSGSPVLNGYGELIGLAFDGNYEGTPGDYIFDPSMNRTISVDIRYVLFIIDKFAGATHLINELTFGQ